MGDEFDGCECIWSHELAMQRLINFIRQNQNACTDTECIDVSGRVAQTGQATGGDTGGNFTIAMVFMILAMFMYIMNPSTWRQLTNNKQNRRDNNQDGAPPPQPPPPPPAIH